MTIIIPIKKQGKSYEEIAAAVGLKSKGSVSKWLANAEDYLEQPQVSPFQVDRSKLTPAEREERIKLVARKIGYFDAKTKRTKGAEKQDAEKNLQAYL